MAASAVDERAFERLYRRYVRDVYRFTLALLRNPSEAEEATQTTFVNAYRALRAGEQPRRPRTWLLTIAHNAARSRARHVSRRPREVPLEAAEADLTAPEREGPNVGELVRALRRLPANQRTAITMRELEGRSYPEIADTLGVSVPAVEGLLARARRTLRAQASAIRGVVVLGLPRSLRRAVGGEAGAGGAAGAGGLAKAVAVVVAGAAGAVAGGVALPSGDAAPQAPQQPAARVVASTPPTRAEHARAVPTRAMRIAAPPPTPRAAAPRPGETQAAPAPVGTRLSSSPAPSLSSAPVGTQAAATPGTATPGTATPAAATPAATTPSLETPTVATPSVTAAGATVPSVTAPSVTVPSVTVPSVTVPSATVPSVPLPTPTPPPPPTTPTTPTTTLPQPVLP